jgi:hypothetical protein
MGDEMAFSHFYDRLNMVIHRATIMKFHCLLRSSLSSKHGTRSFGGSPGDLLAISYFRPLGASVAYAQGMNDLFSVVIVTFS